MRAATTAGSAQVRAVSARALLAAVVTTVVIGAYGTGNLALVAVVVLGVVAFDGRHLLTLKNFFLLYTLVVFGVGAGLLHLAPDSVFVDLLSYTVAFLAGYGIGSLRGRDRLAHGAMPGTATDPRARPTGVPPVAAEAALLVLIGLNLAFLVVQLFRYGVVEYYRGQALLEQFLTYGQASTGGGAEQIARFLLRFSAVGLIVLYVQACLETRTRIRYGYPLTLLVVFPILTLRRYDAVVGGLTALAIYACERRVNAGRRRSDEPDGRSAPARPRPTVGLTRTAAVAGAMVSAVLAALAIGLLRQGLHADTTGAPATGTGSWPILTSELSPLQAYDEIRTNIGALGHPRGRTIVLPLVLKLVPRAWFPDKPLNSGAYYMSTLRPAEFEAGFTIPPTFFGDAYLNFGFAGALAACLLLGAVAARLDRGYKRAMLARVPIFLLVWANSFSIMRDPISESLAGVLLTLAVWLVGSHLLRPKSAAPVVGTPLVGAGRLPAGDPPALQPKRPA